MCRFLFVLFARENGLVFLQVKLLCPKGGGLDYLGTDFFFKTFFILFSIQAFIRLPRHRSSKAAFLNLFFLLRTL